MNSRIAIASVTLFTFLTIGCAHKQTAQVPPPPPPPAAPTATLAANPVSVNAGQTVTLTWKTSNAENVTIAGLGTVGASGSQTVTPKESTDYTLTAKGPGGTADASARVTVTAQAAAAPTPESLLAQFNRMISDVYFDYDKYDIRADQQPLIHKAAQFLSAHPDLKVTIEGHCDSRGSEEYNLALGDNRANSLKTALIASGANPAQFKVISYGKEKPFCSEENEQCWAQNRRDHYVPSGN